MNDYLLEMEKELKIHSKDSTDDLIAYVLFEIQSPIEDYGLAVDLLLECYCKNKDVRLAILGSYIASTWFPFEKNVFLKYLEEHLLDENSKTRSIIYYLLAYDIYRRCDKKYPLEYSDYLKKSISCSDRFVYNYVRLAEISKKKDAKILIRRAVENVVKVWSEEQLQKVTLEMFLRYEAFLNEFILGIDISIFEYKELLKKDRGRYCVLTK